MTTAAAVDRLVHHSVILELSTKRSYRNDVALERALTRLNCYQTRVVASRDLLPALGSNRKAMAWVKRVSQQTRDELIKALGARYEQGGREDKTRILDEFARITGYHCKHAIRLLGGKRAAAWVEGDVNAQVVGVGRDRIYDDAFVATLIVFWETRIASRASASFRCSHCSSTHSSIMGGWP